MKKKGIFCLLAVATGLMLTGCGSSKQLVCTQNQDTTGVKQKATMTVTFKNDSATKMQMEMEATLDDSYKSYMSQIEEQMKSQFSKYEKNGMKVSTSKKDNKILLNISANFDKMSKDEKDALGFNSSDNSYNAVKKSLEDSKFSCK